VPAGSVIDGELVATDSDGRPDYHRLRQRLAAGAAAREQIPVAYLAFDALYLEEKPLLRQPVVRRRARLQSAHLILSKVRDIGGQSPVVVTGDFNCRESSATYRALVGKLPFATGATNNGWLRDTLAESEKPAIGPRKTFRGWMSLFGIGRIDYIFAKNGFRTLQHVTIDDRPPVSDHRAVWAELEHSC
jgi:hypothetical protein